MNDDIYDPLTSYFEIGGEVIEVMTDPPQILPEELDILQDLLEEAGYGYDLERAYHGYGKAKTGIAVGSRGAKVLRAAVILAAADGPLPIGDFIAAGLLLGAGGYMIYSAYGDFRQ